MNRIEGAIAAVFQENGNAQAAYERLHDEGFKDLWMALTKPVAAPSKAEPDASALEEPPHNDVAESSDGALGVIGRFFTGEGNALRRSLEDHGVEPLTAVAIDETLPPHGAVLVLFADSRKELALRIIAGSGGRVDGAAVTPVMTPDPANDHDSSHAPVIRKASPLATRHDVFFDRSPRASAPHPEP